MKYQRDGEIITLGFLAFLLAVESTNLEADVFEEVKSER